jgi:hypothetical protein
MPGLLGRIVGAVVDRGHDRVEARRERLNPHSELNPCAQSQCDSGNFGRADAGNLAAKAKASVVSAATPTTAASRQLAVEATEVQSDGTVTARVPVTYQVGKNYLIITVKPGQDSLTASLCGQEIRIDAKAERAKHAPSSGSAAAPAGSTVPGGAPAVPATTPSPSPSTPNPAPGNPGTAPSLPLNREEMKPPAVASITTTVTLSHQNTTTAHAPTEASSTVSMSTEKLKDLASMLRTRLAPANGPGTPLDDALKTLARLDATSRAEFDRLFPQTYQKGRLGNSTDTLVTLARNPDAHSASGERILRELEGFDSIRQSTFVHDQLKNHMPNAHVGLANLSYQQQNELKSTYQEKFGIRLEDHIRSAQRDIVRQSQLLDLIGDLTSTDVANNLIRHEWYADELLGAINTHTAQAANERFKDLPEGNGKTFLEYIRVQNWSNPEMIVPLIDTSTEVKCAAELYKLMDGASWNDHKKVIEVFQKEPHVEPAEITKAFETYFMYRWRGADKLEDVIKREFSGEQLREVERASKERLSAVGDATLNSKPSAAPEVSGEATTRETEHRSSLTWR